MAEFLTTTDTSAAIERVIRGAEKKLTLISAYVFPRVIYLQRLQDAAGRGVHITLIFGKKRMDEKVMKLFQEIPNLRIYYLDVLHAKCFVNEQEAIVTSLNLLNGSEEKNREMGVRLHHRTDAQAYRECVNEVASILAVATLEYTSPGLLAEAKAPKSTIARGSSGQHKGYCIRTGVEIPFNVNKPLSVEAFRRWSKVGDPDRAEKFCHFSGEPSNGETSMSKPVLWKNWKEAREQFDL